MKKTIASIKKALGIKTNGQLSDMMGISLTQLNNIKSGNGSKSVVFALNLAATTLQYVSPEDRKKLRQGLFDNWAEGMKETLGL